MAKKDENDTPSEVVGAESLGEEAQASVAASIAAERKDTASGPVGGMPAETDYVTPRKNQGRR